MNIKALATIVLIFTHLNLAQAQDVRVYGVDEIPDPDDIAAMLGGAPVVPAAAVPVEPIGRDDSSSYASSYQHNNYRNTVFPSSGTRGICLGDACRKAVTNTAAHVYNKPATPSKKPSAGGSFTLPIQFAYNSDRISNAAKPQLNALGKGISKANVAVIIEGHTDASGSARYNQRLSQRRAQAVKNYLVNIYGIRSNKLIVEGKGETDPLDPSKPYAPENRRVQFRAAR